MNTKELLNIIIDQENLTWEDVFFNIELNDTNIAKVANDVCRKIVLSFMHSKVNKYDIDNFVYLGRKIANYFHHNYDYIEKKIKSVDGSSKDDAINTFCSMIIVFLPYEEACLYADKICKNGKYLYATLFNFDSFKSMYVFAQQIVSSGAKNAIDGRNYISSMLNPPSKM